MLRLALCLVNLMILGSAALETSANLLNEPESVVYDTLRECYYVSNVGDGNIVRVGADGVQSYFNTDLDFTAGMHIVGDTLYACSSNGPNRARRSSRPRLAALRFRSSQVRTPCRWIARINNRALRV